MKKAFLVVGVLLFYAMGAQASPQFDDLEKLIKSGASEEVVIAYINVSDYTYNFSSDEIVRLKDAGATPNEIVAAIQHKGAVQSGANNTSPAASAETTAVAQPRPRMVYRVEPYWRPRRAVNTAWYEQIAKMKQALQIDVLALTGGILKVNYELLLNRRHGIVIEGSYFDNGRDSRGEAGEVAYRFHWARSMNSGFMGIFLKGSRSYGNADQFWDEGDFGYRQTSMTVGPDIGKRWVSPWGFNIVGRVGYGYTWSRFTDPAPDQDTRDRVRYDQGIDYEVSIGYAF